MTRIVAATLATLLLCACGRGGETDGKNGAGSAAAGPVALGPDGKPFKIEQVGEFDEPFALAFLADGRALITEKKGSLKLWQAGKPQVEIRGVPKIAYVGQGGLLDVAPAPDFASSGTLYLTYSEPRPNGSSLALARGHLNLQSGAPRLENVQVIWRAGSDGEGGQFGATLAFAPDGGSLFLTSGERQRFTPAQDPNQALGKILHLTLDGKPAADNPHAGQAGAGEVTVTDPPEDTEKAKAAKGRSFRFEGPNLAPGATWTSGHRNPYGLAFAPDGRLWEIEMGPKGGDELNLIEKGKNYGYPIVSNGDNYNDVPIPDHQTRPEFQAPVLFWNPSISPAGLMFYDGRLWPQWKGSAFIGALSGTALIRIEVSGTTARKADQWDMGKRIRDVVEGPDGAIYLLEDGEKGSGGKLLKLTPVG
jgi:glucose/arabinose dehydrogenase